MNPRILFSNPPWWATGPDGLLRIGIRAGSRWPFTRHSCHMPDSFHFGGYLPFPFFLAHAASYTQARLPSAKVELRDSIARGESYDSFFAYLQQFHPDWLVIETATPSWDHDRGLIQTLADTFPSMRIILGGPLDEDKLPGILKDHPNIKAIVRGEYDKQVAVAITGHPSHRPAEGIPVTDELMPEQWIYPHSLLTVAEMNEAPPPLFDEATAYNYHDGCPVGQQFPHLQLWTSRGCPFRCIFCVWPAVMTGNDPDGTKPRAVRSYSPEWLEAFLTDRIAKAKAAGMPYRSLYLDDDTYNLTKRHVAATAPVLKRIGLPWSAMCRADTLDDEHWRMMKDAGCFGVKLGFESGSQHVIDHIVNKRLNLKEAAERARWLRLELGMTVHGTFTVGLPGETPAQEQETRDFIRMLYQTGGIDTHQLSGTSTIEGTPLHTLTKQGHLEKYDAAKIDERFIQTGDGQLKIERMARG
jgi:hypothetical protein